MARCPKCNAGMTLTGSVCPRCGYDFPLTDDAAPARRKRALAIALAGVVLLGLYALGSWEAAHYSAICARCLQHAYIAEKKCVGVRYHHRRRLSRARGGLMSSATFSPPIPTTDPSLYEAIHGRPCEHIFKKGGYGRSSLFLHVDGACPAWKRFIPRLKALEATYRLFHATKDVALARQTFRIIDRLLPPDATRIRRYDELRDLAQKLDSVGSVEQWERLLDELPRDEVTHNRP